MKRIDNYTAYIITIPLIAPQEEIQSKIDSFVNLNAIDTTNASIWQPEDTLITCQIDQIDEKTRSKP